MKEWHHALNWVSGEMVLRWTRFRAEDLIAWAEKLEKVAGEMRDRARDHAVGQARAPGSSGG